MNTQLILTLNMPEDSILLNEGILNALDWPRQIQILINEDEKVLLLRACTVEEQQAVIIPEDRTVQCEIGGRSFLRRIRRMLGWQDKRPRICYGGYLPALQAIRFSLSDAQPLDVQLKD